MNNLTFYKLVIVVIFATHTISCSVNYVPEPSSISTDVVPTLNGSGNITLNNTQSDDTIRELGTAGFGTMKGDLHSWTNAAITLIKTELKRHGLTMAFPAEKSLSIKVTKAGLDVHGLQFAGSPRCRMKMEVETSSGYKTSISSEGEAVSPPGSCDEAMSQAIVKLFRDKQIIAYLTK